MHNPQKRTTKTAKTTKDHPLEVFAVFVVQAKLAGFFWRPSWTLAKQLQDKMLKKRERIVQE
jgi:hypothetical protein